MLFPKVIIGGRLLKQRTKILIIKCFQSYSELLRVKQVT